MTEATYSQTVRIAFARPGLPGTCTECAQPFFAGLVRIDNGKIVALCWDHFATALHDLRNGAKGEK